MLDPAFIKIAAARGNFHFELIPSLDVPAVSESMAFAGDGVDDLDHLLNIMDRNPKTRVSIDIGDINASLFPIVRSDVVALRTEYIRQHGKVDKINEYLPLGPGSVVFPPAKQRRRC